MTCPYLRTVKIARPHGYRGLLASYVWIRFSSSGQNHYDALGIKNTASKRDIRAAYIRLSKKYHPDTSPDVSTHDQFQKVKEAYDVLSKKNKRYEYDYNLQRKQHPDMPAVDHFSSKYYTDGTFWMGPKDHGKVKRRFTNGQVVVLVVAFGFIGGLAQLWIARKFRDMSEEGAQEGHRRALDHIAEVTKKRASGETPAQKHLAAYREQALVRDKSNKEASVDIGDLEETIIDNAPSS